MNYTYYRRYRPSPRRSSFKSFFWLVLVLVVLLLILRGCVSVVSSLLKDKEDEATLTVNEGSAQVTEWGQTSPNKASSAQLLLVGDTVETGEDSIVTLTFYNGTTVVLDQNTRLLYSEAVMEDTEKELSMELLQGRAFVTQNPDEDTELTVHLHTDVMNIDSLSAVYLVSNDANREYVYGFDGQATVDFVDRSQDDSVIDTVTITKGKKTVLSDEDEKNLLARQSLTLVAEAGDDLLGDRFVAWNNGEVETQDPEVSTEETDELDSTDAEVDADATATEENVVEESTTPVSSLQIKVTSPGLNSTIQKSAIAIEGSIVAGTANTVTVTWDGNGKPYTLGGFAPGDTSFRYVADASYGNFKAGANTFTVVATAADGTVSNTVTVVINAQF